MPSAGPSPRSASRWRRRRARHDREPLFTGLGHAALAGLPRTRALVMRVHPERFADRVRGRRAGVRLDLLQADLVGRERAELADREVEAAVERRLAAPEVERDDPQVTHG